MENFDIFIYAAITIFLISRLWAVLGRRNEGEENDAASRPNPFQTPEKPPADEEDVMVLEGRARSVDPNALTPLGHAPASLAGALEQFRFFDPAFNEKEFLEGAKIAFGKIVACFAEGDLTPVAWLLGPNVRLPFEKAIEARRAAGQTLENHVERLAAADIVSAKMEESAGTISVEFVSHQVNVLRDSSGQIVEGKVGQAEEVRDLWVFRRDLRSGDPNWQLVETRS